MEDTDCLIIFLRTSGLSGFELREPIQRHSMSIAFVRSKSELYCVHTIKAFELDCFATHNTLVQTRVCHTLEKPTPFSYTKTSNIFLDQNSGHRPQRPP